MKLTLQDFGKLNVAEQKLINACLTGKIAEISSIRPANAIKTGEKSNKVRAELIRWLALGGDEENITHAHGVQLVGAWITNKLDLKGATVPTSIVLANCYIEVAPNIRNCVLNGTLTLNGSLLAQGLIADGAKIQGSLFLRDGFETGGEVCLLDATIGGSLDCRDAKLNAHKGQCALIAGRALIKSSVFMCDGFESIGEVNLQGATIGSNLEFTKAKLTTQKGQNALNADLAKIQGSVFLSDSFDSRGVVRLVGATISGNLSFSNAKLTAHEGEYALILDNAQIQGSVFLHKGFESLGEVRLLGAKIGRSLQCQNAKFIAQVGQDALNADNIQIDGNVFLSNCFVSEGEVSFIGASIQSVLVVIGLVQPLKQLNLSHATIGTMHSDKDAWGDHLEIDGLVYGNLREANWKAKDYINWLNKQTVNSLGLIDHDTFKPQPWRQLINVLGKMGNHDVAVEIGIAYEEHRRKIGKLQGCFARFFHKVFGWLAGYGYKPLRLLWWMLGVWLFSATMYFCAAYHGIFTPSDPLVFQNSAYEQACRSYNQDGTEREINNEDKNGNTHNWYTCGALLGEYTTFSPIVYSLDVILPLVDLGQEKAWGVYIATPKASGIYELFGHWSFNHAARFLVWCEILFGWIASLMLVAVLTGLTERDKR